jgi:hypothetical protein
MEGSHRSWRLTAFPHRSVTYERAQHIRHAGVGAMLGDEPA